MKNDFVPFCTNMKSFLHIIEQNLWSHKCSMFHTLIYTIFSNSIKSRNKQLGQVMLIKAASGHTFMWIILGSCLSINRSDNKNSNVLTILCASY